MFSEQNEELTSRYTFIIEPKKWAYLRYITYNSYSVKYLLASA